MEIILTEKDKKMLEIGICYEQYVWYSNESIKWMRLGETQRITKAVEKECENYYINLVNDNKETKLDEFICNWVKECNNIWNNGKEFYYSMLMRFENEYKYQEFINNRIIHYMKQYFEPKKYNEFIQLTRYSEEMQKAIESEMTPDEEKIFKNIRIPRILRFEKEQYILFLKYYAAVDLLVREETSAEIIEKMIDYFRDYESKIKFTKEEKKEISNNIYRELNEEECLEKYIIDKVMEIRDIFGYSSMLVEKMFHDPLWIMPYPTIETFERTKKAMDLLFENIYRDDFLTIDTKLYNSLLERKNQNIIKIFDVSAPFKQPVERFYAIEELENADKIFEREIDLEYKKRPLKLIDEKLEIKPQKEKIEKKIIENKKIEIDIKSLSNNIVNAVHKSGLILNDYECIMNNLYYIENEEIIVHIKESISTINDFLKKSIDFVENIKSYEEQQKIEQYNIITDTLKSTDKALDELKKSTDLLVSRIPKNLYYRFESLLFKDNEKEKNEIRYKYFTILDGTNIANHIFENHRQNEILGILLSGKMTDFYLSNHEVDFNDENINIPMDFKEKWMEVEDINDIKNKALITENEILKLMRQEENITQQNVIKNRIVGLFEFAGNTAKEFFKQIAWNDYGIEFDDEIDIYFARQLIYPGENNFGNFISTSRMEFFTITIPKLDSLLGNNEQIEVSCDDIPKIKELLNSYDIKEEVEYYKDNLEEASEYLRRILLNNHMDILEREKLSAEEYMLIKDNEKLKEENKDVSASMPDIYWIFLMQPKMFKEIEINSDFEDFIKQLAPDYYGAYNSSDYETNIGGLDAHIRGFGNGVFGIGFDLPKEE